jgi:hypothetical protein
MGTSANMSTSNQYVKYTITVVQNSQNAKFLILIRLNVSFYCNILKYV